MKYKYYESVQKLILSYKGSLSVFGFLFSYLLFGHIPISLKFQFTKKCQVLFNGPKHLVLIIVFLPHRWCCKDFFIAISSRSDKLISLAFLHCLKQ